MNSWRLRLPGVIIVSLSAGLLFWGCNHEQERALCQANLPRVDPDEEGGDAAGEGEGDDNENEGRVIRPVRPEEWLQLLVRAGAGERATQECSGQAIQLGEPSEPCREAARETEEARQRGEEVPNRGIATEEPQPVALTDESVIDRRITNSKRLVWVITHEYSNGDGLGPIGLVERVEPDDEDEPSQLRVLAIGTLRARRQAVRLRLITLRVRPVVEVESLACEPSRRGNDETAAGEGGNATPANDEPICERERNVLTIDGVRCQNRMRPETCRPSRQLLRDDDLHLDCEDDERADTCSYPQQVLIAEGETCEPTPEIDDDEENEICYRAASFLFRRDDRFVQAELHHAAGECLGPAIMEYGAGEHVPMPGNWRRDFSLVASYEIRGNDIIVYEQVQANDVFLGVPQVPPRPFRVAESVMHWIPIGTRFVTNREPLWDPMLLYNGSLHLVPGPGERAAPAAAPPDAGNQASAP
jgi:hypothetical protein